jgi:hypothetical protein
MSVFEPSLTNDIALLMTEHQKKHPPSLAAEADAGGTCEATAFSTYGYRSTCLCLPLGNYHNMIDIDQVVAGQRPARVGPSTQRGGLSRSGELLVLCVKDSNRRRVPHCMPGWSSCCTTTGMSLTSRCLTGDRRQETGG